MKKKNFLLTVLVLVTMQSSQAQVPTWPENPTILGSYNLAGGQIIQEDFLCITDSSVITIVHQMNDSWSIGQYDPPVNMIMCIFTNPISAGDEPLECDFEIFIFDTALDYGTYHILFTYDENETGCADIAFTGVNNGTTPVTWGNISVKEVSAGHELIWETLSEVNNEVFIIEQSRDASTWKQVGEVVGNGTTYTQRHYEWVATPVHYGVHYYRIKQIDTDGKYAYSKIVSISSYMKNDPIPIDVFDVGGRYLGRISRWNTIQKLQSGWYIFHQGKQGKRIFVP